MNKREYFKLSVVYIASAFLAYLIWVFFSYLVIPYDTSPYIIRVKYWDCGDYYKVKPGSYYNSVYNTKITINSKGFRTPEFDNKKKDDRFRIMTIGESSTMSLEVHDLETWSRRLERYLQDAGLSVEVLNCGVDGAYSGDHLGMFKKELIDYSPDLVLYYAGRNDLRIYSWERYPGNYHIFECSIPMFLKHYIIYKKCQIRYFFLKFFRFDIERIFPYPNNWQKKYRNNIEQIFSILQKNNIPIIMVTQVLNYPDNMLKVLARGGYEREDILDLITVKDDKWFLFLRQQDLLAMQREFARNYGFVDVMDIHEDFYEAKKSGKELFCDDVHLTVEGNDLVGKAVAERLEGFLSLPER